MISWCYNSTDGRLTGWRHLWMKHVVGFRPEVHCARCLVGPYDWAFGRAMPVNTEVQPRKVVSGAVLYFCGVSLPTRWANNFHLAARPCPGAVLTVELWNGDSITFHGLERVPFDDAAARRLYPDRPSEFLTCRNFQFGAQAFG